MNIGKCLLISLVALSISSCRGCMDKEPQLELQFVDSSGIRPASYDIVRIFSRDTMISIVNPYHTLPLDPGSDRLTFVMTNPDREDTVVVSYKITHEYTGTTCGFNTNASDIRVDHFSGFENVKVYGQTIILVY